MIKNKDLPYEFTYLFASSIDIPAGARQLVLPDDPRIVVFAVTLADDRNNTVVPAVDLTGVELPAKGADEGEASRKNLILGKPVIDRSGQVRNEQAELAVDDNIDTKWCDTSGAKPKFITVDMQQQNEVRGWSVLHAGLEALDYITKEYSLQVSDDGENWTTVDTVYDNTALETDRLLDKPVKARYVRLSVTKPDQSEGNTVRIYEFTVY